MRSYIGIMLGLLSERKKHVNINAIYHCIQQYHALDQFCLGQSCCSKILSITTCTKPNIRKTCLILWCGGSTISLKDYCGLLDCYATPQKKNKYTVHVRIQYVKDIHIHRFHCDINATKNLTRQQMYSKLKY